MEEGSATSARVVSSEGAVSGKRARNSTTRKRTSKAWKYFKLSSTPNGTFNLTCSICGKTYSGEKDPSGSGTTNMNRHLLKHNLNEDDSEPVVRLYSPLDQGMFREKLCASIIKHNYPFRYVEHEGTRELLSFLHPGVEHISRNTAKEDVLKMYKREKEILKHQLENVSSRICLTSDIWTSPSTDGYMALTAHFVDENWILQKRIINFRHVPPPHSGIIVVDKLIHFLKDWGIEKKIFSITLDNASYNDGVVNILKGHLALKDGLVCKGEFIHVRCVAHILNLIVQEGLKVVDISIHKIRECVKYIRWESRKVAFAEFIHQFSSEGGKKVRQDVATRWNATYLMLESALQHRRAFSHMAKVDLNFKTCPTEDEWDKAEKVAKFLKPFYEITTLFSGCKYPTSNLYFLNIWRIEMLIKEEIAKNDLLLSEVAKDMMKKFDKYWESYSMVLSFAIILDPRYKLKMVEFCYSKLGYSATEVYELVENVRTKLYLLFEDYNHTSSSTRDLSPIVNTNVGDQLDEFDTYQSQNHESNMQKSQLGLYLEECPFDRRVHPDLDILNYWRGNSLRFPELSMMARDILSIPITSVASESAFSIGGQIFGKYRNSLLPSTAEALLCTRDWLNVEKFEDDDEDEMLVEDFSNLTVGNTISSNIVE